MKSDANYFHLLDAIRGMAALIVMWRHTDYLFGWKLPESYLAVDLFFALSGVVVANAYESRLRQGLPLGRFMLIRVIRLYPLYLLGSMLGLIPVLAARYGLPAQGLQGDLSWALVAAVWLVPTMSGDDLFPLDTPAWSLFFELWVNLFYAAILRYLNETVLLVIILLSAAGIALSLHFSPVNGLHGGFSPDTMLTGAFRVGFSFFAGVGLYRRFGAAAAQPGSAPRAALACLVLCVLSALLLARPGSAQRLYYDFIAVVLVFPILIRLAMACQLSGKTAQACALLGTLSYPIYVLHVPVGRLVNGALAKGLHLPLESWVPYSGIVFLGFFVPACWLADRLYDAPMRSLLSRLSGLKPARPALGKTG